MTRTLMAAVPSNSTLAAMDISIGGTLDQQLTMMCKCRWRRSPVFTAVGLDGTLRSFWPYQPSSRLELHTAFGGALAAYQLARTRHTCFARHSSLQASLCAPATPVLPGTLPCRPACAHPPHLFCPALFPAGMLLCAFQVFFMQSGFAMLEAGTIRVKNMKNIMLKNGKGMRGLV